jgi:hypothetical protein
MRPEGSTPPPTPRRFDRRPITIEQNATHDSPQAILLDKIKEMKSRPEGAHIGLHEKKALRGKLKELIRDPKSQGGIAKLVAVWPEVLIPMVVRCLHEESNHHLKREVLLDILLAPAASTEERRYQQQRVVNAATLVDPPSEGIAMIVDAVKSCHGRSFEEKEQLAAIADLVRLAILQDLPDFQNEPRLVVKAFKDYEGILDLLSGHEPCIKQKEHLSQIAGFARLAIQDLLDFKNEPKKAAQTLKDYNTFLNLFSWHEPSIKLKRELAEAADLVRFAILQDLSDYRNEPQKVVQTLKDYTEILNLLPAGNPLKAYEEHLFNCHEQAFRSYETAQKAEYLQRLNDLTPPESKDYQVTEQKISEEFDRAKCFALLCQPEFNWNEDYFTGAADAFGDHFPSILSIRNLIQNQDLEAAQRFRSALPDLIQLRTFIQAVDKVLNELKENPPPPRPARLPPLWCHLVAVRKSH